MVGQVVTSTRKLLIVRCLHMYLGTPRQHHGANRSQENHH